MDLQFKRNSFYTTVVIAIFMFLIPISPTLKSLFLWISIMLVVANPYCRKLSWMYTWSSIWCASAIILVSYITISLFWSSASYVSGLEEIKKYLKVLYIPIFATAFINRRSRMWSLNAYLAAATLISVLSCLKAYGWIAIGHTADQGEIFSNHILTGFIISFASYLAGLFFFQYKNSIRLIYLIIFLLTSYQLIFINTGRTGYIIYLVLMILLFLQKLTLKQSFLGMVLIMSLFALSYKTSIITYIKLNELISDVHLYQQNNKFTSLGLRLEFHDYAKSLLVQHPLIGVGAGGFEQHFYESNPVPQWGNKLVEPHSQYWLVLAEQGVIGFILLLFFFANLFCNAFKVTETKPIILGFLSIFFIGCFSDSILCYSLAGYLLVLFCSLSFGELIEIKEAQKITT